MTTDQEKYWTERYLLGQTGWDVGYASPALTDYADQLGDKDVRILIPGAGNSYEAEYLWRKGFHNVHILDISEEPLKNLSRRVSSFPTSNMIHENFFDHSGQYDLILEQTFFCAIDPTLRPDYARKVSELLVPGGKLVGLLFSVPLNDNQPPYGGSVDDYVVLFDPHFKEVSMTPCYNSIEPRKGSEHFIRLTR